MADKQTDAEIIAKLDKPGAGIPKAHLLLTRYFVGPFISKTRKWENDSKTFALCNAKILQYAGKLNDGELATRILVSPQFGLEDSSRYWSAAMVLEHMVIVGTGIRNIIIGLSQGIAPEHKVDTARVKPKGLGTPQDAIKNFTEFNNKTIAEIDAAVKDRQSKTVFEHPWFGPFTAHQWHWLLGGHSSIHLAQMQAIYETLKPDKAPSL